MSQNLPALVDPIPVGPGSATPPTSPPLIDHNPDRARRIRRMLLLARLMDSAIRVPGTQLTFGIDPLVGLVPVVGDVVTTGVSIFIMYDAIKIGANRDQIIRMTANICIDFLIGEILLVGDVVDFAWKANMRNLKVMGIEPAINVASPPTATPP